MTATIASLTLHRCRRVGSLATLAASIDASRSRPRKLRKPGDSANIATVGPDGTDLRHLTHYQGGQVNAFVGGYSPDAHWIVFRLEDHGRHGLCRMRPDGSNFHAILDLPSFKPRFIDWGPRTTR